MTPRWNALLERWERVLALGETVLEELVGAGMSAQLFERHHAFRWEEGLGRGRLVPIERPLGFDLDDLVGVDGAVAAFRRNTEQFLGGHSYNHVLLYGDRGTGKSSAVKGVLERYAGEGLRLVEVATDELVHLPKILAAIGRVDSSHRFLIFCDDLSFAAGEPGYRELKASLEGSIDGPGANVCIVVTSNRRHLVSQSMADNRQAHLDADNELHLGEALEEKLALADRFGLALGFYCFDQATYLEIVERYLEKAGGGVTVEDVREEALRWALGRASRSGRTARQFVDDLMGARALARGAR